MVEYSTALHCPALAVMSVPVHSVLHFIVAHVIVTENCAKYRYRWGIMNIDIRAKSIHFQLELLY